jgi:hypothetical protein
MPDSVQERKERHAAEWSPRLFPWPLYAACAASTREPCLRVLTHAETLCSAGRIWNLPYEGKETETAPFDTLCFDPATEVGSLNLVTTSFGTHLVKLTGRNPG